MFFEQIFVEMILTQTITHLSSYKRFYNQSQVTIEILSETTNELKIFVKTNALKLILMFLYY